MKIERAMAMLVLAGGLAVPFAVNAPAAGAQESAAHRRHRHAVEAQRASDHRHHTGAKIVGGSAVGGAVVGGVLGGGKGALIGGALGAGGGAIANKARDNHDVKQREQSDPR